MRCEHLASRNYDYQCVKERCHEGMHQYEIKGKLHHVGGCCPDGQIVKYESE